MLFLFQKAAVPSKDLHMVCRDHCHLVILHIGDRPCVGKQRGHVRGNIISVCSVADEQRRVLSYGDQLLREIRAEDPHGVSALDAV